MSIKTTLAAFGLSLLLVGCSSALSSDAIGQALQQELVANHQGDLFSIENVKVVKEIESTDTSYSADVSYDLVFQQSMEELRKGLANNASKDVLGALGAGANLVTLQMQYGSFVKGQRVPKREKVEFVKEQQGWLLAKHSEVL
ncbi:hypothetical protein QCD60_27495 [Pokkaliibacter sp. MBI-7]|uniref:hypothetical protein n=1 Tax=Pokkaliibacter sp. MBI-7 TaxID=3040600 RepID=UPI0024468E74|nr:hypothetical protein [Pokkaliibacter sp. MBI-7]MDH2436281.1 hypothetical protein [Pokkaliibacter sp. MBI-7]